MNESQIRPQTRFPWGYATVVALPFAVAACLMALEVLKVAGSMQTPAFALLYLLFPYCMTITGIGLLRLNRGDGRMFPALYWLTWIPVLTLVSLFMRP